MPDRDASDTLATTTKRIGLIGAILTIVLGFNTLISSYFAQRTAHEASIRAILSAEEQYWSAASKELGEIAQLKASADSRGWSVRHKLLRDRIVNHPKLDAVRLGIDLRDEDAVQSIESLRNSVETAIADPEIYGEQAESAQKAFATREEALSVVAQQSNITAEQRQVAQVAAGAIAARTNSITLTPESKDRWDIDLFWCERSEGADSGANFEAALGAGQKLATVARTETRVAGQLLGRIRIKILPLAQQPPNSSRYPSSGLTIGHDPIAAETRLAEGIAAIDGLSGYKPMPNRGVTSAWYISMFACEAGAPP